MAPEGLASRALVLAFALVPSLASLGCFGGPLDSPDPRPPVVHDAGMDLRRDLAVDRVDAGSRDVPADVSDARIDAPPDVRRSDSGWPVVDGCITGEGPPMLTVAQVSPLPLYIGCGPIVRPLVRIRDLLSRGTIFSATLEPLLRGVDLSYGPYLCARDTGSIDINALGTGVLRPGDSLSATLRITPSGPIPSFLTFGPVNIVVVTTDFAIETTVLDFGVVSSGTHPARFLSITNSVGSAPISVLNVSSPNPGPFNIVTVMPSVPIDPGTTAQVLTVAVVANAPGNYVSVYDVSPFAPGVTVDRTCGKIPRLTVMATVLPHSGP